MPTAKYYRDRAAQVRRLLERVRDRELEAQLEGIAREYEELAEAIERASGSESEPD